MSTIVSTNFLLPAYVVTNGDTTGNSWTDPNDILLVDGLFAESDPNNGTASDIEIGGFNPNLPQNAVITGIEMELIAKTGAIGVPGQTLTIYAVDNTSGSDVLYPYTAPVSSLNTTLQTLLLGTPNYQFATSFTPDQINNLKFSLVANGDIFVDSFLMKVYYYIPDVAPAPTPSTDNCESCNSPIQVQAMYLETPFLIGQTQFFLQAGSMQYPDGTPVQPGDVGECGGSIDFVFDEGKPKGDSNNNFEENVTLDLSTGYWTVLPSGVIKVDIGSVNNRGLQFHTPAGHVSALMSDHDANSKVIISNNCKFYLRYVRACQAGTVFSRPIEVQDESTLVANPTEIFNFIGAGVSAVQDGTDPEKVNITIPGFGVKPPNVVSVTYKSSGNTQVTTLDADLDISGLNRGAVVQISTEEAQTVVSVTVGGVACTQESVDTDAPNNIRQEIWACVNPPLGTQSVVITLSGAAYLTFGAEALSEIDTSNMVGNTQTATGSGFVPTLALTTANDNSIVIDGLATAQTPIIYTQGAGQALNWAITANGNTRQGGSSVEEAGLAPDNITMSYAITQSTPWVLTAIEINGIPAVAPIANPLEIQEEGVAVDSNTVTLNFTGAGATASQTSPGVVEVNIPGGGSGSGSALQETVNQTSHGFSVDDVLRSNGTDGEYTLAQADTPANADVVGFVASVTNANEFIIGTGGFFNLNALPGGAVAGDNLWLDETTPGALSLTQPTSTGTVSQPLARVIDASSKLVFWNNWRGIENQAVPVGNANYTVNSDETIISWFTAEVPVGLLPGTTNEMAGWDLTGTTGGTSIQYGGMRAFLDTNSSPQWIFYPPGIGASSQYSSGNQAFRMKFYAQFAPQEVNDVVSVGAVNVAATLSLDETDIATGVRFCSVDAAGTMFAVTADGTANTKTNISASVNLLEWNLFEIIFTPAVNVKYYVNGTLVATHTTNLPDASPSIGAMGIGLHDDNGGAGCIINITPIIISMEL